MAARYIENEIRDFSVGPKKERKGSKGRRASSGVEDSILRSALRLSLQRILKETPPCEATKSRDFSVYTGTTGFCLLFLVLHTRGIGFGVAGRTGQLAGFASPMELAIAYLDAAQASLERQEAKRGPGSQGFTFLTGAAGVHAVGAAVAQRAGETARCRHHAREVAAMEEQALGEGELRSYDLLNGLAGYLSALLFVRANVREEIGEEEVPDPLLLRVVDRIVTDGADAPSGGRWGSPNTPPSPPPVPLPITKTNTQDVDNDLKNTSTEAPPSGGMGSDGGAGSQSGGGAARADAWGEVDPDAGRWEDPNNNSSKASGDIDGSGRKGFAEGGPARAGGKAAAVAVAAAPAADANHSNNNNNGHRKSGSSAGGGGGGGSGSCGGGRRKGRSKRGSSLGSGGGGSGSGSGTRQQAQSKARAEVSRAETVAAEAAEAAAAAAAAVRASSTATAAGDAASEGYGGVLTYEWHAKMYLGAARGVSGILFVLMQALQTVYGASLLVETRGGAGAGKGDLPPQAAEQLYLIRSTVDAVLATALPEGNFPSRPVCADDRLVQWCHGAPGVMTMLTKAYEVFEDDRYLDAAKRSSEAVWRRGLLTKGNGICHGVAGNGYAFLSLRKADGGDGRHLHRARSFAGFTASAILGPNPSASANAFRGDPFGPGAHAHPRSSGGGGGGSGRFSSHHHHDNSKSVPAFGWPDSAHGKSASAAKAAISLSSPAAIAVAVGNGGGGVCGGVCSGSSAGGGVGGHRLGSSGAISSSNGGVVERHELPSQALPDRPMSLFEGLAGAASFLADMVPEAGAGEHAWFPSLELFS